MNYYNNSISEVLTNLKTRKSGLTTKEVKDRLKIDGKNCLKEKKKESLIIKFLKEFKDLMIIILLLSSIISFIISYINKESYVDSIIIIAIVIINAILGFIQEIKADQAIASLKKLQVSKVKVRRNNKIKVINSENIVKGDILVLEAGDQVPADARIIWAASLKVDESSLTGESFPVDKIIDTLDDNMPLSERLNMIYSGASIIYGKCQAVVTEIGMNTEIGLIAKSIDTVEDEITPLQKKIDNISKVLSLIILIIIILMFILGIIKQIALKEIILLSISLAVAAIPEGLPAVITIVLSLGVTSMAEKKAIVRKMSSVETLGCTEIICSDKTGTITQNKMTIREIYFDNKLYSKNFLNEDNILYDIMILNNDVYDNKNEYIGDPTEIALLDFTKKYIDVEKHQERHKRVDELPFDSDRKIMSTINKFGNEYKILSKGSFDSIIDHCSKVLENGEIVKLTETKKRKLKNVEMMESNKSYRVLAFAYKMIEKRYILDNDLENDLIFVGMTSMIDPPREDVKESIMMCKNANIKPIMITGDSLKTACAIAKEIGILENEEEAILGPDLDDLTEEELKEEVKKYTVYARVSPTHKLAIINAWKNNNKVVAMTGDGVNDAPALKQANIGLGMGITGTEVSKNVSDVILSDDSFSTIVAAVKEGRRIFDNIRNVLVFLLTGNIAEVFVVFLAMIFGLEVFVPIQLLYINLITDSLPAIALAFEKEDDNVMKRKARKNDGTFFTPFLISKISLSALFKTICISSIYFISLNYYNNEVASTMAFLTIVMTELVFSFTCRNLKKNIINKNLFNNKYLNISMLILIFIQIIIFVTPIKVLFNICDISLYQALICIVSVMVMFYMDEITKKILVKIFKDE